MKAALSLLALAASAIAFPNQSQDASKVAARHEHEHEHEPCPPPCETCLDDKIAQKLAATWLYFSVNIDRQLAFKTLSSNFSLYSDSDNTAGITGVSRIAFLGIDFNLTS
jgi:hypothetical protein